MGGLRLEPDTPYSSLEESEFETREVWKVLETTQVVNLRTTHQRASQ